MDQFVGRKEELKRLHRLTDFRRVCLVTVQGRRRIGKSRLIQEFAKNKRFIVFTGKIPTEAPTAQAQLENFAKRLADQFSTQKKIYDSWTEAFYHLDDFITDEPTVILFDEISWMSTGDSGLIADFKSWWDLYLQEKSKLVVVLCGSVSTWIEKEVLRSTALYGRIDLMIELKQLSLAESTEFLRLRGFKGSSRDFLKTLAITGGIPRYLEQISPSETVDENIKHLCLHPKGFLTNDFDFVFHDLFDTSGTIYKEILHMLATGMKSFNEIKKVLGDRVTLSKRNVEGQLLTTFPSEGSLEDLINNLVLAGFVTKHYAWSIKTEKVGGDHLYRLSDNYIRFYIKYIEQHREQIETGKYKVQSLASLSGWDINMGLRVESLLLNNRDELIKSLSIDPVDIACDNPYIQRSSTGERGCQIDYLIQTRAQNLFVCEFKFNKNKIGLDIITSMQEKIKSLNAPSEFGIFPVLFHMGEVTESVHDKQYFYRIVNILELCV